MGGLGPGDVVGLVGPGGIPLALHVASESAAATRAQESRLLRKARLL